MESLLPILIFVAIILFRVIAQQSGGKKKTVAVPPPPVASLSAEEQPEGVTGPSVSPCHPLASLLSEKPFPSSSPAKSEQLAVPSKPVDTRRRSATAPPSSVRLDSVRAARQAFIYSEIFRRKYE